MRAIRIIEGAAFGPETVRTAMTAFDDAWSEISDRLPGEAAAAAREALAGFIIAAAREGSSDPRPLKQAGLRAIAKAFPAVVTSTEEDKQHRLRYRN